MVQVKEVLKKLSLHLSYGDVIMNFELGDYDFDTFEHPHDFIYDFTNSENPNIQLRIKDDYPFRVVMMDRKADTTYGKTWNGFDRNENS